MSNEIETEPNAGGFRVVAWPIAGLWLLVAIVFGNSLSGGFVWIDHVEIEQEGYLVKSWQDFGDVWGMTLENYVSRAEGLQQRSAGYYRPVYSLSISIDHALWGNQPFYFHLENVLWHAGVTTLLFLLGCSLFGSRSVAWFAAGCFAIHPLCTHSVSWISGRKDSLCAMFIVIALLACVATVRARHPFYRYGFLVAALVATTLSILSKELGFVTPALAAVVCWYVSSAEQEKAGHSNWPSALAFVATAVPVMVLWVYRANMLDGSGLDADYPSESALLNLATSARLFWWYVLRVLVPGTSQISDAWRVSQEIDVVDLLAIIGMISVSLVAVIGLIRRQPWALALALFLIWMMPASGLVPLRHLRAERYLYPASWALLSCVLIVAASLVQKLNRTAFRQFDVDDTLLESMPRERVGVELGALAILAIPFLLWAGLTTIASNVNWQSDESLFADAIRKDRRYAEGYSGLGSVLLEKQEYAASISFGRQAIYWATEVPEVKAYWSEYATRNNLGLSHYYHGDLELAAEQFRLLLDHDARRSVVWYHLGLVQLAQGNDLAAEQAFKKRLEFAPNDVAAQSNLALVEIRTLRLDDARKRLESLVVVAPDRSNRLNLASVYLALNEDELAYPLLADLLEQDPNNIDVLAKMILCLVRLERVDRARSLVQHAETIAPNDPRVKTVRSLLER